ncbi:MAG: leucyl aminopeptidase family protein, partial [Planctomycetota bacterium]
MPDAPLHLPPDLDIATLGPPVELSDEALVTPAVLLARAPGPGQAKTAPAVEPWAGLLAYAEWQGKPGQVILAPPADASDRRLAVSGLGPATVPASAGQAEARTTRLDAIRLAAAAAAKALAPTPAAVLSFYVDPTYAQDLPREAVVAAIVDGVSLSRFKFGLRRPKPNHPPTTSPRPAAIALPDADRPAAQRAATVARSVLTARTLAALPPNLINPATLAEQCERLAEAVGLCCTIHDEAALERLGMGGLLAVGKAGSTSPRLIQLDWTPPGVDPNDPPTLVVGKAVTFDSGGYNLKTTGGKGMKYDKCGGMAAIGIAEAVARLGHPKRVVALVPAAENLVADSSYRPDDILTMANGVTVEVTNTDAEGRLILADALAWGTATLNPARVIDLATLTGGARVALGDDTAAMFCNAPALADALTDAAAATGERVWCLPLWPRHR